MSNDYRVQLDIYSGPLDLLLYLIRRNEVDLYDIPIAKITEQYLQYVEVIQELDIDLAGDFLVMAATLMEVKSALLLPREEVEGESGEDDLSDPRLELVRQLLAYKGFKDIAGQLGESAEQQLSRFGRPLVDLQRLREELKGEQEIDIESLQIWDLFDAFTQLMKATMAGRHSHAVIHDDTPIDLYETDILDRAQHQQPLTFEEAFRGRTNRIELVGMFLALLELIRQRLVRIEQEAAFGAIYIVPLTELPAATAVAHAVSADIERLPSLINRDQKHSTEKLDRRGREEDDITIETTTVADDLRGLSEEDDSDYGEVSGDIDELGVDAVDVMDEVDTDELDEGQSIAGDGASIKELPAESEGGEPVDRTGIQ